MSRAWASANIARSNVPGMPRKSSCDAASCPSTLIAMRDTPASLNLSIASSVSNGVALGRDVGAQADLDRVADQVEQVGPLERVAAGEHHQGLAERADLVQQAIALFGGQFAGAAFRLRRGAAMYAGQVAGLGGFPDHQHRGLVEVHGVSPLLDDNGLAITGPSGNILKIVAKFDNLWSCLSLLWGISSRAVLRGLRGCHQHPALQ